MSERIPVLTWRIARGEDYNYLRTLPCGLPGFKSYLMQNFYVRDICPWSPPGWIDDPGPGHHSYDCIRFDTEQEATDRAIRDIQSYSYGMGSELNSDEITGMSWPVIAPLQVESFPARVLWVVNELCDESSWESKRRQKAGAIIANYTNPPNIPGSELVRNFPDRDRYMAIDATLDACASTGFSP